MRVVCGRLKSDYNYSNTIVYNNFPWPTATDADRAKIEATAQAILDARAKYPDSSLADLYDAAAMPWAGCRPRRPCPSLPGPQAVFECLHVLRVH